MANIINGESWNAHSKKDVENYIKSQLSEKATSSQLDDNELTIVTHLSNHLNDVDEHLLTHTSEINSALLENEALIMEEYSSLVDEILDNESVMMEAYRELDDKYNTLAETVSVYW